LNESSSTDAAAVPPSTAVPAHRHAHAEKSRLPIWLAIVFALVCGGLTALQSRVNGELADAIDDPYTAAAISFGSGLVILLAALALWRPGRRGLSLTVAALREGRLAWWMVLGGLAGAWFVVTQGLSVSVVGVALFTIAIVAGQMLGGVLFDLMGLGPGGRRPLSITRALGAVLALVAIAWAVSSQLSQNVPLLVMALPFAAGVGAAWQQAVNGRVRSIAQSALTATVVNFAVGTTALVVVVIVHAASVGMPTSMPGEWWLYAGGAIGCVFIAAQAVLVRMVGVLVLALCGVAGQLVTALSLDLLAPTVDRPVDVATIGGTALALVAVVIASIRWSRHRHVAPAASSSEAPVRTPV
jgi:bacterial/archaeal transporter family-2 protein